MSTTMYSVSLKRQSDLKPQITALHCVALQCFSTKMIDEADT